MRRNPYPFAVFAFFLAAVSLAAQAAPEPRRFAILIGINQYFDGNLVQLQKAQNDAEDLGALIKRLGGYKVVNIMSGGLATNDPFFPTKAKIIERVDALAENAESGDQVLFFFSGHGINDKGESYLLPIDEDAKDPTGSAVNLQKDILAKFHAVGVKNVVALIDACQKTVRKDKGLRVVGVDQVVGTGEAVVITSTGAGKASYEDPKGANGLFTRSLLLALNGEADLNHDGFLSVSELEIYLPTAVSEYALNAGMSQKPSVFDSGGGSLQPALARVGGANKTSSDASNGGLASTSAVATVAAAPSAKSQFVTFRLPEGVRVDLRLLSPDGREIKAWSDTSTFSEKLEPGTYRVEAQDRSYLYYPFGASVTVGTAKVAVALDLKPNFGSLSLSCDPGDGVDVLLNGEKRGTLSGGILTVDRLKSGSYELVLSRELYDTKRQTIQIEDGKKAQVKLSLSPNFFTLSVSEKSGMAARLFVDGQDRGALPATLTLPFRNVAVRVVPSDSRYREWTDTVQPGVKGSTEKRVAALAGRMGSLELTTNPDAEAQLTLTPVGGTSGAGATQKIGTAPLDYEALVGDYSVGAEATVGGKRMAASAKVTVREGQVSPLRLELKDATPAAPAQPAVVNGMVLVPSGTFTMGSPEGEAGREKDEVQHQVSLSGFAISATDVTVGEFGAFVNATGYKTSAELDGGAYAWNGKEWAKDAAVLWKTPGFAQVDRNPVVCVSWYDAVAFCNWRSQNEKSSPAYRYKGEADFRKWPKGWNTKTHNDIACDFSASGYRLPTEAEWEYAAKGGGASGSLAMNAVYAGSANIDDVAWYSGNSGNQTHPVGQKAANALGLYDMAGNVWQWCQDWYGDYSSAAQTSPRGPSSGVNRVLRGGSWLYGAAYLRSAYRFDYDPWFRYTYYGFRLVCPQIGK